MANLITGNNITINGTTGNWYTAPGDGTYGAPCYWSRDTGNTYPAGDGTHSLKFTQATGGTRTGVYLDVDISAAKAGGKYRFSCWCKTDSLAGGIGAFVELDAYANTTAVTDLMCKSAGLLGTNNWTQITFDTPFIPIKDTAGNDITKLRIRLKCTSASAGTANFDNFSLELLSATRFDTMIRFPNAYGKMFRTTPDALKLGAFIWPNANHALANLNVLAAVTCPNGDELTETIAAGDVTEGQNNLADISLTGKGLGAYTVVMDLLDDTTVIETRTHTFEWLVQDDDTLPEVYADKYNRVIDNGKPFFPIGAYTHWVNEATRATHLANMEVAGLNALMFFRPQQIDSFDLLDAFVDLCATENLRLLFDFKDCYSTVTSPFARYPSSGDAAYSSGPDLIAGMVARYKDNSAILGWVVNDEGKTEAHIANVTAAYNAIKALDNEHIIMSTCSARQDLPLMKFDEPALFRNLCDVMAVDEYSIRNSRTIDYVGKAADIGMAGIQSARPFWGVIQCTCRPSSTTYSVTQAQMLCAAYQMICKGARGIFFYAWDELELAEANSAGPLHDITDVIAHLKALTDIVLGQDSPYQVTATSGITLKTRIVHGEHWVLATNATAGNIATTFTLPAGIRSYDKAQNGIPGATPDEALSITSNEFTETINAGTCRCYRLYLSTLTPNYRNAMIGDAGL